MTEKLKTQNSKLKTRVRSLKFLFLSCAILFCVLNLTFISYAKEITILYTGETHAMIYPCNCPNEADGGISRRATLINQLRKENPNALVLDTGRFFAGGLMDEYTQNTQLDMQRTVVNLKAMELMKYDAVGIGSDEFNFGVKFFQENINKTGLTFVSCNIESEKLLPYLIKEVRGIKIGITGVTSPSTAEKAKGMKFIDAKTAVRRAVEELKKNGADIILLFSHLEEEENLSLIDEIKGIDIIFLGRSLEEKKAVAKLGPTLILSPSWQGRRIGKLSLTIENNKIAGHRVEQLRLSDKIRDDANILSFLPRCFSNANCREKNLIGSCEDAGKPEARCVFSEPTKVALLILTSKLCTFCDIKPMVDYLKAQFPGLTYSYLYYPSGRANKMVEEFGINGLPAYFLSKDIEKEKGFISLKGRIEKKGDMHMLKPDFAGISYFLDREKLKGKLDLFLSLYDENVEKLLEAIKEFNPVIHFLAIEKAGKFDALKGNLEVEDYLRALCIKRYFPEHFWDYLNCRAKDIYSSWWQDCLPGLDSDKIKSCAQSEEGATLLRENINLNKELKVMFGPTYLVDNQEIFSSIGIPTKETFKKTFKR